ncbi:hypothetical protein FRX31_031504 [Thalictrum thalictroides]|uniref:Uncharacterized protein n=1 Tax=Thalictrum thalictroides TaxID=46969 RepID=A0A7J6V2J3_THATH|nr:hypothetical protein FRX31_031504 [Thalictrum thalictroides]
MKENETIRGRVDDSTNSSITTRFMAVSLCEGNLNGNLWLKIYYMQISTISNNGFFFLNSEQVRFSLFIL